MKLLFNHLLYDAQFVDKAIEDFSDICNIKKVDNVILIEPKAKIEAEAIGYEFYNYVLCLMKNS